MYQSERVANVLLSNLYTVLRDLQPAAESDSPEVYHMHCSGSFDRVGPFINIGSSIMP